MPPKLAPAYIPANITNDDKGSFPYIVGNNTAIALEGPKPGSTPTRVPITEPKKHRKIIVGFVNMVCSPCKSIVEFHLSNMLNRIPVSNGILSITSKIRYIDPTHKTEKIIIRATVSFLI
jgi:hypothetical protein